MELDDFKQTWNNSAAQSAAPAYDLNVLLAKKADDPLSLLKMKYRKQLILLPAAAAILLWTNLANPAMEQHAISWIAIVLLLLLTVNYYYNYSVVVKMQHSAAESVKQCLETNLLTLQRNGKLHLQLTSIFLIVAIAALEIALYKNLLPVYQDWAAISIPLRVAAYAGIVVAQVYISKYYFKLHFGQYFSRLQDLLNMAN